jgi:hypothetical protein
MNPERRKYAVVALAAVAVIASANPVFAAAYSWTGGGANTNWTTVSNWGGLNYPGSSTDTATLPTRATAQTINLDSNITLGSGSTSLTVSGNNDYTLNGSNTTITATATAGDDIVKSGTGTWTIGSGVTLKVDGNRGFAYGGGVVDIQGQLLPSSGAFVEIFNNAGTTTDSTRPQFRISGTAADLGVTYRLRTSTTTGVFQIGSDTALGDGDATNGNSLNPKSGTNIEAYGGNRSVKVKQFMFNGTNNFIGSNNLTVVGQGYLEANTVVDVAASGTAVTIDGGGLSTTINSFTAAGTSQSLTKQGNGDLRIIGNNRADTLDVGPGGISVTAGRLFIDIANAGTTGGVRNRTGAITISGGATLGGNAKFDRKITMNAANAILSPGDRGGSFAPRIATLNINGRTSGADTSRGFAAASGFTYDLDMNGTGTTNDRIIVSGSDAGSLVLGGTTTVNVANLGLGSIQANAPYTIFTAPGITTTGWTVGTLPQGWEVGNNPFSVSGNDLQISFTSVAVPEPAMLGLFSGATLLLTRRRQRN